MSPTSQDRSQKDSCKGEPIQRILNSDEIFSGLREVTIKHQGHSYRLMITKAGKLILNK